MLRGAVTAREQGDVQGERSLLEQHINEKVPDSRVAYPLYGKLLRNYTDNDDFTAAIRVGEHELATAGGPGQDHARRQCQP